MSFPRFQVQTLMLVVVLAAIGLWVTTRFLDLPELIFITPSALFLGICGVLVYRYRNL